MLRHFQILSPVEAARISICSEKVAIYSIAETLRFCEVPFSVNVQETKAEEYHCLLCLCTKFPGMNSDLFTVTRQLQGQSSEPSI
jgi:hypothetical protein